MCLLMVDMFFSVWVVSVWIRWNLNGLTGVLEQKLDQLVYSLCVFCLKIDVASVMGANAR